MAASFREKFNQVKQQAGKLNVVWQAPSVIKRGLAKCPHAH
jgi:hypothetical protein